ncbi:hypothetical protein [Haloarchaeobius sp. DFWS5]|uniref:hypothetical protein n=1 Tax=Haloarchaeobius sp. DFWS5 TaxID=3446114 RepID=UPI003EBEAE83
MEQDQRTSIARGGLSFLLAGVVVFVIGITNTPSSLGLAVALVVLGLLIGGVAYQFDQPILAAIWMAPVIAAVVLFVQQDTDGPGLVTQALIVGAIGIAQVFFSQIGK